MRVYGVDARENRRGLKKVMDENEAKRKNKI